MNFDADTAAAVLTAISVAFLGFQLFQANRLQRNKVEEDYLRSALDSVHLGYLSIQNLAFTFDDLKRTGAAPVGTAAPYTPEVAAIISQYRKELGQFASSVQNAIIFAESIERIHGTGEYGEVIRALTSASKTSFEVQKAFGDILRGQMRLNQLVVDPRFTDSVGAAERAAAVLAEKIVRMYNLGDAQP